MLKQSLIALTAAATITFPALARAPHEMGCDAVKTTLEGIECRTKQINVADAKLKRYLDAATLRAREFNLGADQIEREQALWAKYKEQHCGNVYSVWQEGTIRNEMYAQCSLRLTRQRTYDVWAAHLTFVDSTPPVLPDPLK